MNIARLFILGILSPFLIYLLLVFQRYVIVNFKNTPNVVKLPKYKLLVWNIHRLMSALNPYYSDLTKEGKSKFLRRVIVLLQQKRFRAKEGEVDTIEKRIVILGALTQLTFGLKKFNLPSFDLIRLYPRAFYSAYLQTHVKGLTNRKGTISLSWLDTMRGVHDTSDNIHLALHEWSHALLIDHQDDYTQFLYSSMNKYIAKAEGFFEHIKKQQIKDHYLRAYAFTNEHEFFAVSVEHFFETPATFASELPELYTIMCALLNQNPLNREGDYSYITQKSK
ncbi:MAG: Mlc titration factor MtfA (ptsG expression regulator) [Bacteroidia bacterium]|jgi:Mlc titration factor MtfA (ptsG expression regulator)